MKNVYLYFQLTIIFVMTTSCREENKGVLKSVNDLLTQEEWILAGYGYDENFNGRIDPSEESISVCEKDNSYVFSKNGIATLFDNTVPCGGTPEQRVPWRLVNDNSQLDLHFYVASILRVNEQELVIYEDLAGSDGQPLRFMTVLRH